MPTARRQTRPNAAPTTVRPAGRSEPQSTTIPGLTGLRGLAALGVLAYHAWVFARVPAVVPDSPVVSAILAWPMRIGWSGVDVFFTLSAFLLGLPYARAAVAATRAPHWGVYMRRRVLRIVPAYWVQWAVLAIGAAAAWSFGPLVPGWPESGHVIAQLALWINAWPRVPPQLGTWWTLPVEFGAYLLLPWMARAFAPRRWRWLLLPVVLAWSWRAFWLAQGPLDPARVGWIEHLPGRIDQFAVGLLAAYGWERWRASGRVFAPRRADAVLALAIVALLALPALLLLDGRGNVDDLPSLHPAVLPWHTLESACIAAMLVACAAGAPMSRLLDAPPLRWLGKVSYSLYLWHLPAISWVLLEGGTPAADAFWPYFAACLLASFALAALSWWSIERPALRIAHARDNSGRGDLR